MKVACLTCFIPRRENVNGPSGLLYQTLKWRPAHVSITVFLFVHDLKGYLDHPEVIELVENGIKFVACTADSKRPTAPRYWPLGARQIADFSMPVLDDFDAVWAYPYWFAPFLLHLQHPVLISGMDCATLLYWRKLKNTPVMQLGKFFRTVAGLIANALFEIQHLRNYKVHVVGQADAHILQQVAISATYIPHPFLAYPPVDRPARNKGNALTLLLSNPGDPIYGSPRYLHWIQYLFKNLPNELPTHLIVHKAAPDALSAINAAAHHYPHVTVEHITWVDDYSALLFTVDIQLFPLDIGAGTKTSVLTALQHGVHAICSPVAAENVQPNLLLFVADDHSNLFGDVLSQALASINKCDKLPKLAETLTKHSPKNCGTLFWNHIIHHDK